MSHPTPESILGPPPPPSSSAVAASDLAAFEAHLASLPDSAVASIGFDPRSNAVLVRTIDGETGDLVEERAFDAGEGAAGWQEAEQSYERRQDEWMLGKSRAEIEEVFGWHEGLTEEEMQEDLKMRLGLEEEGDEE